MIRYSHSHIEDLTFVSGGTGSEIKNQITGALTACGWGTVTSDIYQSIALDTGQLCRVEIRDQTGTNGNVALRLKTPTLSAREFFIKPISGRTYRIWANCYQLFFTSANPILVNTEGSDVCFGIPWLPQYNADVLSDPYVGYMYGNAGKNNSGVITPDNNLFGFRGLWKWANICAGVWDGACTLEIQAGDIGNANMYLVHQCGYSNPMGTFVDNTMYWEDGSLSIWEPILSWYSGHATMGNWSPPVRKGQLWDSFWWPRPMNADVIRTVFDKRWRNLTHKNDGAGGGNTLIGALLFLIP